jgi:hypothetical protein
VARGEPAEEQGCNVGPRDEQDETDRTDKRVERWPERPDERRDVHPRFADVVRVEPGRELLVVRASERGQFVGRLLQRDVRPQACDRLRVSGAGLDLNRRQAADFEDSRGEELYLFERRRGAAAECRPPARTDR